MRAQTVAEAKGDDFVGDTDRTQMTSISLNTDFMKKVPGILKLCQLILGTVCMSLMVHYSIIGSGHVLGSSECFYMITTVTYFIITFLIIISSLLSINTETRLRQTLFESMYHAMGCIMYFAGSVAVLADQNKYVGWVARRDGFTAAGGIGIINCILYGASAFDSYRAYSTE